MDKAVASRGTYSRKEVREIIKSGQVMVNGQVETAPERKVSEEDEVAVRGSPLPGQHICLMLHKPAGYLCATRDKHAPTVMELVPATLQRKGLFPAGRLDKDTLGFVLITDDGALAHRLLSPKSHVPKTYRAILDKPIADPTGLETAFHSGVELGGGCECGPSQLRVLQNGSTPEVEVVLYEGMYHQVKRMFSQFGYRVTWLKRTAIGGLALDPSLPSGHCRALTKQEVRMLLECALCTCLGIA